MSASQRLQEHKAPSGPPEGAFFISGIKIHCVRIDLRKTYEMSMNCTAVVAASGAFAERVDDAVRASSAAAREAREP